jgi:hypothetical protein
MESRDQELAALLTLLRRKSGGATWNDIAAGVAASESATALLTGPD